MKNNTNKKLLRMLASVVKVSDGCLKIRNPSLYPWQHQCGQRAYLLMTWHWSTIERTILFLQPTLWDTAEDLNKVLSSGNSSKWWLSPKREKETYVKLQNQFVAKPLWKISNSTDTHDYFGNHFHARKILAWTYGWQRLENVNLFLALNHSSVMKAWDCDVRGYEPYAVDTSWAAPPPCGFRHGHRIVELRPIWQQFEAWPKRFVLPCSI